MTACCPKARPKSVSDLEEDPNIAREVVIPTNHVARLDASARHASVDLCCRLAPEDTSTLSVQNLNTGAEAPQTH